MITGDQYETVLKGAENAVKSGSVTLKAYLEQQFGPFDPDRIMDTGDKTVMPFRISFNQLKATNYFRTLSSSFMNDSGAVAPEGFTDKNDYLNSYATLMDAIELVVELNNSDDRVELARKFLVKPTESNTLEQIKWYATAVILRGDGLTTKQQYLDAIKQQID
ncbi:hypothetical protein [Lacticaseibacillus saniviri]